jgi:hypothetical protein
MSNINNLLNALQGVKRTGQNKWVACCCAHDDKSPSLAIKELDDGRILLHCFAGCDVASIVGAIGFDMQELFPERLEIKKGERRTFDAYQVLECLRDESMIVLLAASDICANGFISVDDAIRVQQAHERISAAYDLARGR